jgi:hypothetical protein
MRKCFVKATLIVTLIFCFTMTAWGFGEPVPTAPAAGDGSAGAPYEVSNIAELYWVTQDSSRWGFHYIQTADIDAYDSIYWDGGAGFTPIGDAITQFTGSYDGGGFTISNFFMDRLGTDNLGLIGYASGATLTNISLVDVDVTGDNNVGGLVGQFDNGIITGCSVTGLVVGASHIGGMAGVVLNSATVAACSSTATISGGEMLGGLIGRMDGIFVADSFATGDVIGIYDLGNSSHAMWVGGLIGMNTSLVTDCYAIGAVLGNSTVGGLVGLNFGGEINNSYATGDVSNVTGEAWAVGGLVGLMDSPSATITDSYATGSITVTTVAGFGSEIGGLVGAMFNGAVATSYAEVDINAPSCMVVGGIAGVVMGGDISKSYSTGNVVGYDSVGGFIGHFNSSGYVSDCFATGNVTGEHSVAGFIYSGGNIVRSYSIGTLVGGVQIGFSGGDSFSVLASFWDTETSGVNFSETGVGLTTAEMMTEVTFTAESWNFGTTWAIEEGATYPYLRDVVAPYNFGPVIVEGDGPLVVAMDEDASPIAWAAPTLSATDVDADDILTWSVTVAATNGEAVVSGTGASPTTFTYTPDPDFNGSDSFTIQVADGNGGTDTIVVDVNVTAQQDAAVGGCFLQTLGAGN